MFKTCVTGLDNMDFLQNAIIQLGARHIKYHSGEKREYYLAGETFIYTLKTILNERTNDPFSEELEEAWFRMYNFVADMMMSSYDATKNAA